MSTATSSTHAIDLSDGKNFATPVRGNYFNPFCTYITLTKKGDSVALQLQSSGSDLLHVSLVRSR